MDDAYTGWSSGPNSRGSAEIIWSCLFTIFVCTWTTLHVNVPTHAGSYKWGLSYKLRLMAIGILAPEYIAGIAFTGFRTALVLNRYMRAAGSKEWTVKHSHFVAMGGYMLCSADVYRPLCAGNFIRWHQEGLITLPEVPTKAAKSPVAKPSADITCEPKIAATGIRTSESPTLRDIQTTAKSPLAKSSTDITLGPQTAAEAVRRSESPTDNFERLQLPWISSAEIDNRAKADYLLKAIACAQIFWFLVQYISRAVQSLATSTLEATTFAFVVCALFSYAAWWTKPYELQAPLVVQVPSNNRIAALLKEQATYISFNNDPDIEVDSDIFWLYLIPSCAAFLAYSNLHFLGWNAPFVTATEKWLWRASTIAAVWFHIFGFGIAFYLAIFHDFKVSAPSGTRLYTTAQVRLMPGFMRSFLLRWHLLGDHENSYDPGWLAVILLMLHSVAYVSARMYILVEAFAGLRWVPISMYDTVDWTRFLPRVN